MGSGVFVVAGGVAAWGFGSGPARERVLCVVCLARLRAVVLLPCRHLSLCALCAADVPTCPLCRSTVEQTMAVFV